MGMRMTPVEYLERHYDQDLALGYQRLDGDMVLFKPRGIACGTFAVQLMFTLKGDGDALQYRSRPGDDDDDQ